MTAAPMNTTPMVATPPGLTSLVACPASDPTAEITPLGSVEAYDAILNDDYAFVAYKETDRSTGAWRVRIKGRHTTGVVFEPEAMRLNARSAAAQGKPFFTWGNCMDATPGDRRSIQFRVLVRDGKPSAIQIELQLRKADGSADEPRSMTVAWPA